MVPAVFIFGDSLADVGNNNHIKLCLVKADFPHNGVDFPEGKATGRFSNGKNAADFLAEKLGLPTSPPYLSLASVSNKTNAFLGGVSFASGGAGILDTTDKRLGSIPLNQQIDYHSTVYGRLVQQLGSVGVQNHLSKSIFAIVIGSNDILGYFKSGSNLSQQYTPQQFIDLLTLTLMVIGAGAIGCCPSQRNQNKTGGCHEETNYWSLQYNEGVKSFLKGMKSELKEVNYAFFDTYTVLLNFIQEPARYGFNEVKAACCGLGNLNARVPCLPIAKYCQNRNDHIFWDLYHPTEAAARIFADTIFDGSQQYMYPINVRQLVAI
ncbi:Lipase [Macleaya cordata]|uniref:Lipase n=1 Tax=Macleaya cordata TaxID=56857 RepID=A0A200QBG3_MACCD|nr:Lipase [Macleaya cordata]